MAIKYAEKSVAMVSAVAEVLRLRKQKGAMTPEEMMRDLTGFLKYTKGQEVKVLMVAAASKALDLMTKNPRLTDKEVMGQMVKLIPELVSDLGGN